MALKHLVTTICSCIQCVHCCEDMPQDWCIHDKNPNGKDATEIENKYTIPSWCPLEDAKIIK